eukprot:3422108-Pyramimonas_sp.AAC.1
MISRLKCTVKTHKPAGEVELRAIHASTGSPLTGGMRYVSSLLRPFLARQPHILRDSQDLLHQLRGIAVLENDRFLKIDIKDYFMSGEHHQLIHHSSQAIECPASRQ